MSQKPSKKIGQLISARMQPVTEDDEVRLILALACGRGKKGFTKEEGQNLLNWAVFVRSCNAILDAILSGEVIVSDVGVGNVLVEINDNEDNRDLIKRIDCVLREGQK